MAFRLRVARTESSASQTALCGGRPLFEFHNDLRAVLSQRVPSVTLEVLSSPVRSADGRHVEWYSGLSGQPIPLSQLQGDARDRAEGLLRDRLAALRAQAETLAAQGQTVAAEALRMASAPPGPDMVYVVNGQPVVVQWDRPRAGFVAPPPPAPAMAAPVTPAVRPWWRLPLILLGLLLLLLALGFGLRSCDSLHLPAFLGGAGDTATTDTTPPANGDEAALRDEAARLEQDLRDRLKSCPGPVEAPPPATTPIPEKPPEPAVPPQPAAPEADKAPKDQSAQPVPKSPAKPEEKPAPPKPAPAAPKPTVPGKSSDAKPEQTPPQNQSAACPKPVPKWQAPEVVVLLDGSGSMGLPTNITDSEIKNLIRRAYAGDPAAIQRLQQLERSVGGSNSRIAAAKQAVDAVVHSLPPEIDVGLVVFGECHGADNYKFFGAADRPRLSQLLASVQPRDGTPLARGLERAGNMMDGVSVPGVIVVVSDGEDSCNGDPCAAARQLKARKPNLKINVIDVNGTGAGRCMADATGGRVLSTHEGMDWKDLIQKATDQPARPPGCG